MGSLSHPSLSLPKLLAREPHCIQKLRASAATSPPSSLAFHTVCDSAVHTAGPFAARISTLTNPYVVFTNSGTSKHVVVFLSKPHTVAANSHLSCSKSRMKPPAEENTLFKHNTRRKPSQYHAHRTTPKPSQARAPTTTSHRREQHGEFRRRTSTVDHHGKI